MTESLPILVIVSRRRASRAGGASRIVLWRSRATRRAADAAVMAELARAQTTPRRGSKPWSDAAATASRSLQHAVNERLDTVSHRLGDSMEKTTQNTTSSICKSCNERLAVIDSAQKNITELATPGDLAAKRARQQAVARRLRPGPHGIDRPRRPAEGRLRIPVHAVQQYAAGLRDLHAGQAPARHRRQISA